MIEEFTTQSLLSQRAWAALRAISLRRFGPTFFARASLPSTEISFRRSGLSLIMRSFAIATAAAFFFFAISSSVYPYRREAWKKRRN